MVDRDELVGLVARLRLYADQVEIADEKESEFSRDMNYAANLIESGWVF